MKKTGAQIIVKLLELEGIRVVSGIPGGSILPLYDELCKSKIRHILVRQEQAAGFIAQGMARTTGKPAVCMATSGPGAMNLLTAIADARSDSIPIVAITGQVNMSLIGTDAFQEADTFGLSFPIAKHSMAVKTPLELLRAIPAAFKIANNGRKGPVLVDVPRDVQLAEAEFENWPVIEDDPAESQNVRFITPPQKIDALAEEACDLFVKARRPVLYLGGGCNSPSGAQSVADFLSLYRLPIVSSLMGIGCVANDHKDYAGMVGMHGFYAANKAMYESDLVFAAGARFDDRATGISEQFCPDAKIIHIDIDAAEINKILSADISFVSTCQTVVPKITARLKEKLAAQGNENAQSARNEWADKIASLAKETFSFQCGSPLPSGKSSSGKKLANPRLFIADIPTLAAEAGVKEDDIIVTTDVGQHQMWVAQYYPVKKPRTLLTSGSLGTMGFGLPAAIGAAIENPEKRIVCFSGDGSIMMNIQELITLAENNLAVTIIVLENGTLGMVYQQQKYLFNKTYSASRFDSKPDFVKIAQGFGVEATDADTDENWYKKAFDPNRSKKPFLVRVSVDPEEDVLPFVPGGKINIDAIR